MDLIDAEEYKCRTNFFQGDENDPINRQVFDYFDFLLRDFERTMEFYSNRNHQKVDRIYLMGGGALLEGLAKFMEEQLSIEVRLISDVFEEYQRVGAIGRHISVFSQAIGTTFREEWKYEG
jgi:Tfp pilus assembly PilM family ATPase